MIILSISWINESWVCIGCQGEKHYTSMQLGIIGGVIDSFTVVILFRIIKWHTIRCIFFFVKVVEHLHSIISLSSILFKLMNLYFLNLLAFTIFLDKLLHPVKFQTFVDSSSILCACFRWCPFWWAKAAIYAVYIQMYRTDSRCGSCVSVSPLLCWPFLCNLCK